MPRSQPHPSSTHADFSWDIFCTVIDNFGDIGVTWRLAKQLSSDGHGTVRLWVDDLNSFKYIAPGLDPNLNEQWLEGVCVMLWGKTIPDVTPALSVIEAFACELPASFRAAMAQQNPKPHWLNLEYLSAEEWIEGCHGLASPQPEGLNKYFFFPGFTAKSGGLLCERDLIAERDRYQNDITAQNHFWQQLGLPPKKEDELRISLFAYENPAIQTLVRSWRQSSTPITLLVPVGRALADVLRGLDVGIETASSGDRFKVDNLQVQILPMTDQRGYDRLLWSCDLNIVRGEDSFVRAQWAGRPFIWHIYRQEEDYHLEKLEAFLTRYLENAPSKLAPLAQWQLDFNRETLTEESWQKLLNYRDLWQQHAQIWPKQLLQAGDLVTRLVNFLKSAL